MIDWKKVAEQWHSEQPHPLNPALKVAEFATAVKLATKMKFGGHASAQEAGAFWGEFQQMNHTLGAQGKPPVTPLEMGHLIDRISPVSFAYHGRPPTMQEVAQHRDSTPAQVHTYYSDLPDQHYPHVSAGQMAKYLTLADAHAQEHLGRPPVKLEAARFALGNFSSEDVAGYYRGLGGVQMRPRMPAPGGKDPFTGDPTPGRSGIPGWGEGVPPHPDPQAGGIRRRLGENTPGISGEGRTPTLPAPEPSHGGEQE